MNKATDNNLMEKVRDGNAEKLGVLPEEQPSDSVRARFYTALEKYKQSLEKEKVQPNLGKLLDGWLERWAPRRPVFQFSMALMLLVVGLTAGYFLHAGLQRGGEIARLRQEVHQVRQIAEVSLLRQESLSERLRGIGVTSRVEQSDEGTLEALLRIVSSDTNINTRLAAIDALHLLPDYPLIRQEFVQALSEQTSPLMALALSSIHLFLTSISGFTFSVPTVFENGDDPLVKTILGQV